MYGIINKTNVQNVKNTMLDILLSHLAPHLCYSCGRIGSILCDNCKYDITEEPFSACVMCNEVFSVNGLCSKCKAFFTHVWCVGERRDTLLRIIDDYKFENVKAAHKTLASLLSGRIGILPPSAVVTSIPTIPSHIRQRGYDHASLLAKELARQQNLRYTPLLKRLTTAEQRGASKKQRYAQAKQAFAAKPVSGGIYLLVDDIVTTGATLNFGAKALLDAGADEVWAAVIARQPS